MGVHRVQKRIASQAIHSASARSRIVGAGAAIAANYVVSRVARMRRIVDSKLGMVENVEALGTEFQVPFAKDFPMLQERRIEIGTGGIIERIAAAITKGKAARSDIGRRVVKQRAERTRNDLTVLNVTIGSTYAIGVRTGPKVVCNASVIGNPDATGAPTIDDAEGRATLMNDDAGELPTVKPNF